jgi:DNA-directed RNA polymerase specialized sigma24 family protein
LLRHYLDYNVADTAAVLGISNGATTRYTSDGLQKLRTLLENAEEAR